MNKKTDKEPTYKAISILFILLAATLFVVTGFVLNCLMQDIYAHAEDTWTVVNVDGVQCRYYTAFDNLDEDEYYYFYCNADRYYTDNYQDGNIKEGWYLYFRKNAYSELSITENNGIYTVENINTNFMYKYGDGNGTTSGTLIDGFKYDTVNNIFWYLRNSNWIQCGVNVCFNINTNCFDITGSLTVEFLPFELSGNINDVMTVEGSEMRSYAVQMIITNTTHKNYQYFWCICPKGEHPYFSGVTDLNNYNGKAFSGPVQWCHVKESWAYILNPDIINATLDSTTEDTSNLNIPVSQYTYLPSSWQYIASNSSKTESAFFKNMKLFEGQDYTCYVYAVETSCDKLSFISEEFTSGYLDEYLGNKVVDFRDAECIYSSNFKMGFTTEFDPDYNAVGVISYDPDSNSNSLFNSSSARYNPETNALEMGYNLANYRNNPTSYTFSGSANKSNLSTFSGAFSNVFSFVSAFFSYLPSSYQQMYFFGLTALVVLSILKAVR